MLTVMEFIMEFNSETRMKDIALSNPAARQAPEDAGWIIAVAASRFTRRAFARMSRRGNIEPFARKGQRHRTWGPELGGSAVVRTHAAYLREAPSVRSRIDSSHASLVGKSLHKTRSESC